jgi:hypothetical protein
MDWKERVLLTFQLGFACWIAMSLKIEDQFLQLSL